MLKAFQKVALWEAISTVLLFFVAMPLKYLFDYPLAVKVMGNIHGILVIAFVVLLIICKKEQQWSWRKVITYFVVSVIPVVSFWIEKDVRKDMERQALNG